MKTTLTRKVSDLTINEFKLLIRETISGELEAWRETLEIMADENLMRKIKRADEDWERDRESTYVSWDEVRE